MNISITEIRDNLADALNRVAYGGERVILQRRGKGVAALVSLEELALLEELENKADVEAALKARAEGGKPISLEEYLAKLETKPRRRKAGK
jgi:prevent-host-death family protein